MWCQIRSSCSRFRVISLQSLYLFSGRASLFFSPHGLALSLHRQSQPFLPEASLACQESPWVARLAQLLLTGPFPLAFLTQPVGDELSLPSYVDEFSQSIKSRSTSWQSMSFHPTVNTHPHSHTCRERERKRAHIYCLGIARTRSFQMGLT